MSASDFRRRVRETEIGRISPARVLRPSQRLTILFTDHGHQTTEIVCPACGARITVRCLRIDMTAIPAAA